MDSGNIHQQQMAPVSGIYQQAEHSVLGRWCRPVIDSSMTRAQALAQNPKFPAPPEIIDQQRLLTVQYYSFDGKLHEGQIVVNKKVAKDVEGFFRLARHLHFPIGKAIPAADLRYAWNDNKMMADNNSSGYNYRKIAGSPNLSNHARGLALDINTFLNPYIYVDNNGTVVTDPPGAVYNPQAPGTLTKHHPLVKYMKAHGWTWGGDWTLEADEVIDYQHFEKPEAQ